MRVLLPKRLQDQARDRDEKGPPTTKDAEEAAKNFPQNKGALDKDLADIDALLAKKKWEAASTKLSQVEQKVGPLLSSSIATTPDVVALRKRFETQRASLKVALDKLGKQPGYCPGLALKGSRLGSHPPPCAVGMYLAKTLNDPNSFQSEGCDVGISGESWVANCTFRARNAFGALVQQTWRFTIKNDQVINAQQL